MKFRGAALALLVFAACSHPPDRVAIVTEPPATASPTPSPSPSTAPTPHTTSHASRPNAPVKTTTAPVRTPAFDRSASVGGCQLFPSDNAWRRDVSRDPVDPNSANYIASIGSSNVHPDFGSDPTYGIPFVVVPRAQSGVRINFTAYGDESDPGPYPVPLNAPIESGSDHHVLAVQQGTCKLYEMYNAVRQSDHWDADSGAVFDLNSDKLRPAGWTSADAAGLPILPGLVRRDEIATGAIDHALRFTAPRTQRGYVDPARHFASSSTDPNLPPMGLRLRLKASFDLSGYHGASLVILKALKRYGMILADNGSSWYITGATDTGWNDDDLDQMKRVPGSAFEVVKRGPIHTS
jgi:hypothetical protein